MISRDRQLAGVFDEQDTTEYLLSTEANRKHLSEAIDNVRKRQNLVVIAPDEWNEKYRVRKSQSLL